MAGVILFLTDYGLDDEFVGVCHAVMAAAAPEVRVIDLAHGVPPGDVRRGALSLLAAVPHAPPGAVLLAVVDPGVGTGRRAIAAEAGGAVLVGPDNGLLSPAWEALGGVDRAVEIDAASVARRRVSATFHGRDVFAPAAARLATGVALEEVGRPVDPGSLARIDLPTPRRQEGALGTEVIGVDRFGNVQLGARPSDLGHSGLLEAGIAVGLPEQTFRCRRVRAFADLEEDELGLLEDSAGWLALVRRGGSAAARLGVKPGDGLLLSWPAWDSAS
ncbi:MAG: SAM hydrolase/SAM-dependent halogenase family protein [Actinomycetota bacterium]